MHFFLKNIHFLSSNFSVHFPPFFSQVVIHTWMVLSPGGENLNRCPACATLFLADAQRWLCHAAVTNLSNKFKISIVHINNSSVQKDRQNLVIYFYTPDTSQIYLFFSWPIMCFKKTCKIHILLKVLSDVVPVQ